MWSHLARPPRSKDLFPTAQSVDHVVDSESARIVAFMDQFCPLSMSLQLSSYLLIIADGSQDFAIKYNNKNTTNSKRLVQRQRHGDSQIMAAVNQRAASSFSFLLTEKWETFVCLFVCLTGLNGGIHAGDVLFPIIISPG